MPNATATAGADKEPLMVRLPEGIDTNRTYRLVDPDGEHWDVVYDVLNGTWAVLAF